MSSLAPGLKRAKTLLIRTKIKDFVCQYWGTNRRTFDNYLANIDCLGTGPERIRVGRKVVYPVKGFVEWLEARSTAIPRKGGRPMMTGEPKLTAQIDFTKDGRLLAIRL